MCAIDIFPVVILTWLAACAISDARTGGISNWLTLPAVLVGCAVALLAGWARSAVFGGVVVIAVAMYLAGWMGGGDVKILAALAGLSPEMLPVALLGICVWGVARRVIGWKGRFRAVSPMLAAAVVWMAMEWLELGRVTT